jgi:ATP-dependent Clp protease, protease subunit
MTHLSPDGSHDDWSLWLRTKLFEQRVVFLRGDLTDELAGQVAAELMTLDASGDEPIQLHVDSGGGTLEAAFTVMDTIDLLGVTVEATCVGRAHGPAVGIVAVATRRYAAPHAGFRLTEPTTSVQGTAANLELWAKHYHDQHARFLQRLVEATRQPIEHVEADVLAGRYLDAEAALRYGLVDDIRRPPGAIRALPTNRPQLGFQPPGR